MARFANKRIGILGGTFNPVHNGHLHIARHAIKRLRLDKVIFVPTRTPPHKKIRGRVKTSDRLRMLRLAIDGEKRFAISLYEIKKRCTSYSIKTARYLRKKYGKKAKLFFLVGGDSLRGLKKWKNIKHLQSIVQFAVLPRRGFSAKTKNCPDALRINAPQKVISSTTIRRFAKEKKSIKRLVPEKVFRYIKKKKLYKE